MFVYYLSILYFWNVKVEISLKYLQCLKSIHGVRYQELVFGQFKVYLNFSVWFNSSPSYLVTEELIFVAI